MTKVNSKVQEIQQKLNTVSDDLAETDKLLKGQTKLIEDTCVSSSTSILNHLLTKTLSKVDIATNQKKKAITVLFERSITTITLNPDEYRIAYKIELSYQKEYSTNTYELAIELAVKLPDKYFYGELANEIYKAYKIIGLILVEISDKKGLYKLITDAYKYIKEQITIEEKLQGLSENKNTQVRHLKANLNFAEFDEKLQPLNIILTSDGEQLIIHKVTKHTVLVSSRNSVMHKHKIGEKFKMHKPTLYTHYTNNWNHWRVLSKEEYIEEFI